MRHVFPTSEIPHKWAHQTQDAARNAQGNLYFRGPTIYSYRDSWPLARIYVRKGVKKPWGELVNHSPRDILVLTNSAKYSNTTAKHQYEVNRAASHLPQIAVPFPVTDDRHPDHKDNLAHFMNVAAFALKKKAQHCLTVNAFDWAQRDARSAFQGAADYLAFFNIRRKAPVFPAADWNAASLRVHRIANPDPASADKRERASAARKEATLAKREYLEAQRQSAEAAREAREFYPNMAIRTDWRLHEAFNTYSYRPSGACMLRVTGDEIETSHGARVPLAAAPMVWNLVQRALALGGFAREFKAGFTDTTGSVRNYVRPVIRIGDYPLDRIDADGTLHAGCHVIPYSELAALARQLGLVQS